MFLVRRYDITSWKSLPQDIIALIRLQDWFGKKARNFLWIIFVMRWVLSLLITKQIPMQRLVQGFCYMKQNVLALKHLSNSNENWKFVPQSCKTHKKRFALPTPCFNLLKQRNNLLILCFIFLKSRKNFLDSNIVKIRLVEVNLIRWITKKDAVLPYRFIERG